MSRIPRHFHFVFGLRPQTEPFHVVYYLCLESCLRVNRPERVTLHYHHEPYGPWWERIRGRLHLNRVEPAARVEQASYADPLVASFRYAHHADFIRLERLLAEGGVYADIDTLFVNPLPEELFEKACVLGRERDLARADGSGADEGWCNALIMAEPGARFVLRWLEAMPAAFDGSWSAHSCQLAARLGRAHPGEVHLEPERSFYPYAWTREDLRALLEEGREIRRKAQDWAGVYSLHLWNHLWWSARRMDFSEMNGERLTERFIRQGTTTYTRAAREFLPAAKEHGRLARIAAGLADRLRELWARRFVAVERLRRWRRALRAKRAR